MSNVKERTFVILKPDSIQRGLIGDIIRRLERTGLKLVGMKLLRADEKRLLEHYGKTDEWYGKKGAKRKVMLADAGKPVDESRSDIEYGKDIIRGVVRYMTACPVVAMVWQGNQAMAVVKKLVGDTDPTASDVGTIRGDYQLDSYSLSDAEQRGIRNIIHCTDPADGASEAEREIGIWFSDAELHEYAHVFDAILTDVNLDGTPE